MRDEDMTPELAFKTIVEKWQQKKFITHTCSICGYVCGYIWKDGDLFYDSGCICIKEKIVEPRSELELLDFLRENPELTALNFGLHEVPSN